MVMIRMMVATSKCPRLGRWRWQLLSHTPCRRTCRGIPPVGNSDDDGGDDRINHLSADNYNDNTHHLIKSTMALLCGGIHTCKDDSGNDFDVYVNN